MRCCVPDCLNDTKNGTENDGISFHRFPKELHVRKLWIEALGIVGWEPEERSVVCSEHFQQEAFYETKSGTRRVKRDVVPVSDIEIFSVLQSNQVKLESSDEEVDDKCVEIKQESQEEGEMVESCEPNCALAQPNGSENKENQSNFTENYEGTSDLMHDNISDTYSNYDPPKQDFTSSRDSFLGDSALKQGSLNNELSQFSDRSLILQNEPEIENNSNDTKIPMRQPQNTSKVRGKDFCFYCESLVLNFSRHILRKHRCETDVQRILSLPKKSIERKRLITVLRKKGNFIINSVEVSKPMKKNHLTDYLPCTECLGFYSKKLLWKHKKKCAGKTNKNVQSEAQNLLIKHMINDVKLKETVFRRMRADKISLIAKSDPLICAFGSQYLKVHSENHFVHVVSRKMRELAKLLMELKKIDPHIQNLFDALKPNLYDNIVSATKVLSKYDSVKDRFNAPTFAMNMSTILKQCCHIAITHALKKQGPYMNIDTGKKEDLKTMIQIIDANWKYDISSQAATDRNKKKRNKITIVPLANDLKILKEYLKKKSEEAAIKITEGSQNRVTYYTELLETVYCRVLLLNRHRPGELQRLKLHDYLEGENNVSDKYEEFDRALTASERVLVQKFKRVVISGKRGRVVPVLFTNEVQDDIKLLLSLRDDMFQSLTNDYLFGNPGFDNTIYGYKVLVRYARLSGAKNPKAISSMRLRKHLATLSQIFSMSENDLEQLATFMGHTNKVHKKSYRLVDDVYQTAKISKLLILMENGKADTYKGKSLDEIDLDMNEELDEEDIQNDHILQYDYDKNNIADSDSVHKNNQNECIQPGSSGFQNNYHHSIKQTESLSNNKRVIKGKKRTLVPWTLEQKNVVTRFFKFHIKKHRPPKRNECEVLKEKYPELLCNKDWAKIKVFVQNIYTKSKK